MRLLFIGAGYVGLVTGTCFADLGNDVICLDVDTKRIDALNKGTTPIYEPGLTELTTRNVRLGRLQFTTDPSSIGDADILFICVGTPPKENGESNLTYVFSAAESIGKHLAKTAVIVIKSTVPVGTAEKVRRIISAELKTRNADISFDVASNPEFLREGAAVKDFQNPDRIVIGCSQPSTRELLAKLYAPTSRSTRPVMFTSERNAELIKYASNAMLATRISFMNELSHLCEEVGADIKEVAKGMGLDSRIGPRFLQAGCGYGGSCFPKDVKALAQTLEQYGFSSNLLRSVDYINERQKRSLVPKLKKLLPSLEGKRIAIWGLSFKPRTDDIREAPSLTVIDQLLKEYASVTVYDPEALRNVKALFGDAITYSPTSYDALNGADALIILAEWDEFREPDFARMKSLMNKPIIIDGRNIYAPRELAAQGFTYRGVGR